MTSADPEDDESVVSLDFHNSILNVIHFVEVVMGGAPYISRGIRGASGTNRTSILGWPIRRD
jgi:hypothetical protein